VRRRQGVAVAAAAGAVAWSTWALPSIGSGRARVAANVAFATGFAYAVRRLAGRSEPVRWVAREGLLVGAAAAAVPIGGFAVAAALPSARTRLAERTDDTTTAEFLEWILVRIPVGTVFAEELIFRGTVSPVLEDAFGLAVGGGLAATAFGLWHIRPAMIAGDSVVGTVAATAAAGLVFDWLRRRGDHLAGPALLHLATNVGGAVVVRAVSGERGV